MPSADLVLSGSSEPDDSTPVSALTSVHGPVRIPLDEREWLVLRQRDTGTAYEDVGRLIGAGPQQVRSIEALARHKLLVNLAYDELGNVVDGEVIGDAPTSPAAVAETPTRKWLIQRGRDSLRDFGYNPDDWVDAETEAELRTATSERTWETLCWGWGRFIHYCGVTGRNHESPTSATIRQYIKDHWHMVYVASGKKRGRYGQPYSPRTVELAVYTVAMVCNRMEWRNPVRHPKVRAQLVAYRIKYEDAGFRSDEADPVSDEQLAALLRACDGRTAGGVRNAALVAIQFDTGARGGELVKLQVGDVRWLSDDEVQLTFVTTKGRTRKRSSTRTVNVVRTPDVFDENGRLVPDAYADVDPLVLFRRWWKLLRAAGFTSGPVWRSVQTVPPRRGGWPAGDEVFGSILDSPMQFRDYDQAFRRLVDKTGISRDPETGQRVLHVTTHSGRVSLITKGRRAGIAKEVIARRTGHSPTSPSFDRYFRVDDELGEANVGVQIRRAAQRAAG